MIGPGRINKPGWLCTINYLAQGAMEKDILHIQLMNMPVQG
jgi:hypothetical protein